MIEICDVTKASSKKVTPRPFQRDLNGQHRQTQ